MGQVISAVIGIALACFFGFSVAAKHYGERLKIVCEYVANRPEVTEKYKPLVVEPEGCEIFVRTQRDSK
jgi:hypothetical protein